MRKNLNKKILELNILNEKNLENILNDKNLEKEVLNTIHNYAKTFDIDGFPAFVEGKKESGESVFCQIIFTKIWQELKKKLATSLISWYKFIRYN